MTGKPSKKTVTNCKLLCSWFEVYAFRVGGPDSKEVAIIYTDLTEIKKHEAELAFHAELLSNDRDAVVAIDKDSNVIYWNEVAEIKFGWSTQEAIGKSIEEVLPFPSYFPRKEMSLQIDLDRSYNGEIVFQRKNGDVIYTDARIKYLVDEDGKFSGAVGAYRDITQRKLEERELKGLREDLVAEVEALSNLHALSKRIMVQDDLQNTCEEILDAALKVTCANKGHIVIADEKIECQEIVALRGFAESTMDTLNLFIENKAPAAIAINTWKRIVVEDLNEGSFYSVPTKNIMVKEEGIVSIQSTPMISSSGNLIGTLSTHYTSRHHFNERELRILDMLSRLAADAIERTKAEEALFISERRALALIEELRKMDENKNDFLAMLSHELRNPLASIAMSHPVLNLVPQGGEEYRKAQKILYRQTAQLTRIVDDLLDVTRISRNKVELKKERIDLCKLVSTIVENYQAIYTSEGIQLKTELYHEPIYLDADPARMAQVIDNLLHNAVKFSEEGSCVKVTTSLDKTNCEGVIEVIDHGLGVNPDILPDLFLPFVQVDQELDRSYGGLGLGLSVCKGMVDLHQGTITAYSEGLGKGTQFTIRLPLPATTEKILEEKHHIGEEIKRALRILVIDDIPDVAEILCSLLRLQGHETVSAHTGTDGIAKARDIIPDVILCDIGLPDILGYDVARSIRNDNTLKGIYLVAVSGYAQEDDKQKSVAAGFNNHCAKPVDLAILAKILSEIP